LGHAIESVLGERFHDLIEGASLHVEVLAMKPWKSVIRPDFGIIIQYQLQWGHGDQMLWKSISRAKT